MEKPAAELMKEYVNNQKFTSTTKVMEAMKTMFADVLQEVMSAELDETLGYEKSQRLLQDSENNLSKNYRNYCICCGTATDTIHDYRTQTIKNIPAFG